MAQRQAEVVSTAVQRWFRWGPCVMGPIGRAGRRLGTAATVLALLPGVAWSAEYLVHDAAGYASAAKGLKPGDTVVLADGTWRDVDLLLTGTGTIGQPIRLTA